MRITVLWILVDGDSLYTENYRVPLFCTTDEMNTALGTCQILVKILIHSLANCTS